ncbi:sulfurtransferase [Pseudothauera rhizosphaerae]|uniref:Sulfurtransferase n=1 Tax=Pseudothauera rhizosphaerae TaxID=2565932 RepID=A0A4S4AS63_9RHOO|nr:rhodanese-like domain-containing protein [Pseudothauera rhizosphaerae]THF62645.1 sulfurtransferase [Pseudothauera rhizosphaerae]
MKLASRKLANILLFSLALSSAGFIPVTAPEALAREVAVSAAAIDYERDWVVSGRAAYELIQQGALVIDARGDDLKKKSKIANASSVIWQDLAEPDLPTKGRLLSDPNVVNKKLQALGVSKDRPIVVLADPVNGWGEDGRITWALRTWGHDKVVVVDGGLAAVQKEGPLNIQPPKTPGDFVVAPTSKWEIRKEELKQSLSNKNLVVLDVREPREYEGKTPYGESRGGHVPGAKGLWYKDFIGKDGKLLPRAEIEKVLASKGITRDSEVVAYCTGGIRSGWFTTVLNDLGYNVRNYAGSMWEWSAQPAAEYPLVKN